MTKKQALEGFKETKKITIERYGKNDICAIEQAWHTYTDFLCKTKEITISQYENWKTPKFNNKKELV